MSNNDSLEERTMVEPQSALHQRPCGNVPWLLKTRQEWGNLSRRPARYRGSRVTPTTVSSSAAWNASRMNNMILAVGPGTPATAVSMTDSDSSSSSGSSSVGGNEEEKEEESEQKQADVEEEEEEEEEEDEEDNDDGEEERKESGGFRVKMRARWVLRSHREREEDQQRRRTRSASSDEDDHGSTHGAVFDWMMGSDIDDSGDDDHSIDLLRGMQRAQQHRGNVAGTKFAAPSMRHGGCINTAAWLTCPWRLSLTCPDSPSGIFSSSQSSNNESLARSVPTQDCPTQLITSGDDRVVKFWDVRYAMGTANPLAGGINTICPFSAPTIPSPQAAFKEWKEYQKRSPTSSPISGMVVPLATLSTGHRGNVFHAVPLFGHPGKVSTCGADGYLRVADVESPRTPSIVVSPEFDSEDAAGVLPAGLLSLRPGMCFSHHFLNVNTGLLCSERGLRRFDLRLNPSEQRSRSILGGPFRSCKSCAIWSANEASSDDVDSAYVFAGGSSGDVALYDLRMTDGSGSKVVQHYRPRGLASDATVSVSGLDISWDKRELLVSYENDQIYSFPIFPNASSAAGPTIDELNACCRTIDSDENDAGETSVLRELASYGGHLNRYTFLKNAKYAGPKDKYICTGSDSGNAWIYERETGAVVSLLNADHSTCNGVVPHPTLPLFVTYGIDSTAKLWRASTPVDKDVDDSPVGRARCQNMLNYEKSPIVHNWKNVQTTLLSVSDLDNESFSVLPDEVPSRDEELERSIFESLGSIFFRGRRRAGPHGPGGPYIGNNLRNLPEVLRHNLFACVRAKESGDDDPVRSGLEELRRRMNTIRLRHQADQHGLLWDSTLPWIMRPREYYIRKRSTFAESSKQGNMQAEVPEAIKYGHPIDHIPDKPSEWIPYDPEMTSTPMPCGTNFNIEDYEDFYAERYGSSTSFSAMSKCSEGEDHGRWISQQEHEVSSSEAEHEPESVPMELNGVHTEETKAERDSDHVASETISSPQDADQTATSKHSWKLLYDTVLLLKEGGNAALQAGQLPVAARRYDKAIQYCSVAFMTFPYGNVEFVKPQRASALGNNGHEYRWFPLLKLLINTRLNLAMAMLKPQLADFSGAAEQAHQALVELKPFALKKGKVMMGSKHDQVRPGDEPIETYREAKELQAKAYFRLGTAQYASKDFAGAAKSFEHSIKSTKETSEDAKPEKVVFLRLAEARKENEKKKKRHRKKFKRMFAGEDEQQEEKNDSEGVKESQEPE